MRKQSGFTLLEGLIAILIFSVAMLGLVGLQAAVVRETGEAKYRMEAALFASQIIGQMWGQDKANLVANFESPGPYYLAWQAEMVAAGGLPGVAANPPTIDVGTNNQVTVTIFWQSPGIPAGTPAHRYSVITQLQ